MNLGHLEEVDGRWRLRFTRRLRHSPEKVWRALTEPVQLAAWFPDTIEGDWHPGARLRFAEGSGYAFDGEVVSVSRPGCLSSPGAATGYASRSRLTATDRSSR